METGRFIILSIVIVLALIGLIYLLYIVEKKERKSLFIDPRTKEEIKLLHTVKLRDCNLKVCNTICVYLDLNTCQVSALALSDFYNIYKVWKQKK